MRERSIMVAPLSRQPMCTMYHVMQPHCELMLRDYLCHVPPSVIWANPLLSECTIEDICGADVGGVDERSVAAGYFETYDQQPKREAVRETRVVDRVVDPGA